VTSDEWTPKNPREWEPAEASLIGGIIATIIFAVLGATAATGEYASGRIRLTFTATPRRGRVGKAGRAMSAGRLGAGSCKAWAMRLMSTVILGGKTATGIPIPAEVVEALGNGRKRFPVRATVDGHIYRTTIAPMAGEFFIPLNAANREAAGVAAGDDVTVELERDDTPREVEIPSALAVAFAGNPRARGVFDALSYSKQRRIAEWVAGAKTEETRTRRITKALGELTVEAHGDPALPEGQTLSSSVSATCRSSSSR
jgi:hypothetical protein